MRLTLSANNPELQRLTHEGTTSVESAYVSVPLGHTATHFLVVFYANSPFRHVLTHTLFELSW